MLARRAMALGPSTVEKGGGRGVDIFTFDKNVDAVEKSAKCLTCQKNSRHGPVEHGNPYP